jgi:hypothetical protein
MPYTNVRIVVLRKWFPPEDPLATMIARVCILRGDLLIEMQGVYAEAIEGLDSSSAEHRRMYFLRNMIRTQAELSASIQRLLGNADFRVLLERQPEAIQTKFKEMAKVIGEVHPLLKDVRNDICGHVLENAVQMALKRISWESFDFLEVGDAANLTHFKFANEIVAEMLLKDVSEEERKEIRSSKFAQLAKILPAFTLIDYCFVLYSMDRGFLPRHILR